MAEARTPSPLLNRLLALLPANIYQRLLLDLKLIPLRFGAEIHGAGETQEFVYFPTTAVISLLSSVELGRSTEIGIVGNDGIVGIAPFMGGGSAAHRAVVQCAGDAFRMRSNAVMSVFNSSEIFRRSPVELHAVFDRPDVADGGLQPLPFRGPTTLPMATAKPRPRAFERTSHDARAYRRQTGSVS